MFQGICSLGLLEKPEPLPMMSMQTLMQTEFVEMAMLVALERAADSSLDATTALLGDCW